MRRRTVIAGGLSAAALGCAAARSIPAEPQARGAVPITAWAKADRNTPHRSLNLIAGAERLNAALAAEGSPERVELRLLTSAARDYAADSQALMRAFAVGKGPDIFIAGHVFTSLLASYDFAAPIDGEIAAHPGLFDGIAPSLWRAASYNGRPVGAPMDTEVRMLFLNKDMLRRIGKSDAFINSISTKIDKGAFTLSELSALAREVVAAGAAEYGILHRPDSGAEWLMLMRAHGGEAQGADGRLQASRETLRAMFRGLADNVAHGITPAHNTTMTWSAINAAFLEERAFIKVHGIWDVRRQIASGLVEDDPDAYFRTIAWLNMPPAIHGGAPTNFSHPFVYGVNPKTARRDLAVRLIGHALSPDLNRKATAYSRMLGVYGEAKDAEPASSESGARWESAAAASLLPHAAFMPNHRKIGQYTEILFRGVESVETGRKTPDAAADMAMRDFMTELGEDFRQTA